MKIKQFYNSLSDANNLSVLFLKSKYLPSGNWQPCANQLIFNTPSYFSADFLHWQLVTIGNFFFFFFKSAGRQAVIWKLQYFRVKPAMYAHTKWEELWKFLQVRKVELSNKKIPTWALKLKNIDLSRGPQVPRGDRKQAVERYSW